MGGGNRFWRPGDATGWVEAEEAEYEGEVSGYLRDLLAEFNNRNTEAVHRHLRTLNDAISSDLDGSIDMFFGGSVKKHTAVDGLSDVDVLMMVNRSSLADASPAEVLTYLEQRIRERLPNTDIKVGELAVTVTYSDGIQLQVLPALQTATGIRIADGESWSRVVRPQVFAQQLTEVNQSCGNQVVPVIKLFKGMQSSLPKEQKISSYHIEALAVEAFQNYDGRRTPKDMLAHLVHYAEKRVMIPIAEATGQSKHVDDKLGEAFSIARERVSAAFARLFQKFEEADRRKDADLIKGIFEP